MRPIDLVSGDPDEEAHVLREHDGKEAAVAFETAVERNPHFLRGHLRLAATYGQLERIDEAEWEVQEALTLLPGATLRQRRDIVPYKRQVDIDRYIDGLRMAGLPE